MGKISYLEHVRKNNISVVLAEIIFQNLKSKYKTFPLSKVADTSSGGTPNRSNHYYYGGNIHWLKSGELNDAIISESEEYITEEGLNNSSAKIFPKGTLLVAMYGATAGKVAILDIDAATNQAICAVFPKNDNFRKDFLFWFFRAHRYYFIDVSRGGAQPNISQTVINNTEIPIISTQEQGMITEFLSLVEEKKEINFSLIPKEIHTTVKITFNYFTSVLELEKENANQNSYLKQLRQSILQEAIEGKLTAEWRKQNPVRKGDPADAVALLEKIKQEKKKLIAEGKIKNEKPLAPVKSEEVPFELPEGWVWCRLGEIASIVRGGSPRPAGENLL